MDFKDVVANRKSVRSYSNQAVEEEKLTGILEAARIAPSWANKQCCNYIVVRDKAKIEALAGMFFSWIKEAPIILAACADPKESGVRNGMDYYLVDVGISMQQLVLAATSEGLGTCWIGAFDEAKVKKVLEVPKNVKVIALTPVGYPAEESMKIKIGKKLIGAGKRRSLEEMVHKEKW
jgi:nitroreductase